MTSQAKESSVVSTEGNGNSRVRLAGLVAAFTLAILVFTAAPVFGATGSVTIDSATPSYSSVQLESTFVLDPGSFVRGSFQISTDGVNWPPFSGSSEVAFLPGEGSEHVTKVFNELSGGTKYYFRFFTVPGDGIPISNVVSVTTLPVPKPTVLDVEDASDVSYITAKVSGKVAGSSGPDPAAFDSTCRFQYVTDAKYVESGFADISGQADCNPNPVVGSGETAVEANLTDLKPGTTYHLRLLAFNGGGSDSKEATGTFTTLPVAAPTVLSIDAPTNVAFTQAELSGSIERPAGPDPAAFDARCRFDYVTAQQFLESGFAGAGQADCDPERATTTGPTTVESHLTGLTVGTTYYYRLVAFNAGGSDFKEAANTFTTPVPGAPTVSIFAPTGITATSAHFSGEIDPGGLDPGQSVNWHFECTPACPGLEGAVPAGSPEQVSADATGLRVNTTYEVSLVAANAGNQASAGPEQFTTGALKPVTTTLPAFALAGGTEALVGGMVDSQNSTTTYWVEYGSGDSYGSSIPLGQDGDAGSGEGPIFVTQKIIGLKPSTTYRFRLVAKNPVGTSAGQDIPFTTAPADGLGSSIGRTPLPDNRAWEQVSPVAKNGADVFRVGAQASISGDALTFRSQGSFADQPTSKGGNLSDYLSRRGPGAWSTTGITPPGGLFSSEVGYHEFSDDLGFGRLRRVEIAGKTLDPEFVTDPNAIAAVARFYVRNNSTGQYKIQPDGFAGASSDLSHVAIQSGDELTPDGCTFFCVYEKVGGEPLKLASRLPDGTSEYGQFAGISKDGSRVYFTGLINPHLFARVNGMATVQIDTAERTQPPTGGGGGSPSLAGVEGPNGERVLFVSGEQLVDGDEDSANDLYTWDGTAAVGERLTLVSQGNMSGVEAEFGAVLGSAEDRFANQSVQRGYFTAANQVLANQPSLPGQKIYAWDRGAGQPSLRYVATVADGSLVSGGVSASVRTSPDGRYLAFVSSERLTAYDNAGKKEVYRYDSGAGELICVSCDPEGRPATASAVFNFVSDAESTYPMPHVLRNLSSHGQVFFETAEGLVPGDSNGQLDIYEYENGAPRLLSLGTGGDESRFLDASVSGDDVFFVTADRLVGWDKGHDFDVYDARVGGGLPEPPPGIVGCEGDACQPAPVPPNDPTPASATFNGAGNVKVKSGHKKKSAKHRKRHKGEHKKRQKGKHQSAKRSHGPDSTRRQGQGS